MVQRFGLVAYLLLVGFLLLRWEQTLLLALAPSTAPSTHPPSNQTHQLSEIGWYYMIGVFVLLPLSTLLIVNMRLSRALHLAKNPGETEA